MQHLLPTLSLLTCGFILTAVQIQSVDIIRLLIGHNFSGDMAVVLITFFGLLLGLTNWLKPWATKLMLLCSAFQLILGLFFTDLTLLGLAHPMTELLLLTGTAILLMTSGAVLILTLYSPQFDLNKYIYTHLAAASAAVVLLLLIREIDKTALHLATSAALLFLFSFLRRNPPQKISLQFNADSFESIAWGTASGVFMNYFFNVSHALFYPSGLEFHFYLILVFLFLAGAGLWTLYVNRRSSLALAYNFALGLTAATAWYLSYAEEKYLFDPLRLAMHFHLEYYPALVLVTMGFLLLPYLFICLAVPSQQTGRGTENHVFFTTLGSACTQALLMLPLFNLNLQHRLVLFATFVGLAAFAQAKRLTKSMLPAVAFIFFIIIFLPKTFEGQLSDHARRFYSTYWLSDQWLKRFAKIEHTRSPEQIVLRKRDYLGSIGGTIPFLKFLTLNGYSAETYLPHDYFKALVTQITSDKIKPKKILLLGLGNHLVLKKLITGYPNAHVDVVDNSPVLADTEFRNTLAFEAGLHWPLENVQLLTEDALQFGFKTERRYDLIVWNLTLPNYLDSPPLFSNEFGKQLSHLLVHNGALVIPFYENAFYDCVHFNFYDHFDLYPSQSLSLIVFYKNGLAETATLRRLRAICRSQETIQFYSKAKERMFDMQVIHKKNWLFDEGGLLNLPAPPGPAMDFLSGLFHEPSVSSDVYYINSNATEVSTLLSVNPRSKKVEPTLSVVDNYGLLYQKQKTNQMLSFYIKPDAVIVDLFPSLLEEQALPPWLSVEKKLLLSEALGTQADTTFPVLARRHMIIDVDDSDFFKKNITARSNVYLAGNTRFHRHLQKTLSAITTVHAGTPTTESRGTVVLAASSPKEIDVFHSILRDAPHIEQVLIWLPPWQRPANHFTSSKKIKMIRWLPKTCTGLPTLDIHALAAPSRKTSSFLIRFSIHAIEEDSPLEHRCDYRITSKNE